MKKRLQNTFVFSMALAFAIAVAGVSHALPVGKTIRYDHLYVGVEDGVLYVQESHYLRIDSLGQAAAVSSDGLSVTLQVDDSAGYDQYTVTVGSASFVTPWDGVGELVTVDNGDGRTVRLKADGGFARNEREATFDHLQNLLEFIIGGAIWIFMMWGVRRHGWWF